MFGSLVLGVLLIVLVVVVSRRVAEAEDRGAVVGGIATFGALAAGLLGLIFGFILLIGGNGGEGGLALAASGLAFGLLANAIYRK